jgi:tetratricopeptide (TPR) repeat protein
VGPAADTYALGAILYELLTGRPPFRADTAAETVRQVISQDPVPPSRMNAAVPRDPETICLKCLEKDPRRRYASAAALAEDLERFQRDEPIAARPVGPAGRVLRWTRRHPTGAALVATALALVGLAGGGGVWLVQQRAELRSEVGTAVAQAVSLRKRFHFREARALLEEARQRLGPARPDDLRRQVDQERADLDLAENLDTARLRAATPVEGRFEIAGAGSLYAESLYEETFSKVGLGGPGDDSEVAAARVRDSTVRAELVAALDDWASITPDPARRAWLSAVARGADRDPSRDRLRQPELWDDGPGLTKLVEELPVDELSPQLTTALGRGLLRTGGDAVPLLSAAQARYPQDFWLNFELGLALNVSGRSDEALGFYRAALALRPEASPAHNGVGLSLFDIGRVDEAIGHYEQALNIDPNFALAHNNLGSALLAKGQLDEAIGHYQEAIRLDPKGSAMAHDNLGSALLAKGRLDEAIGQFQESIRLNPKGSFAAHINLGAALGGKGQLDEAISHYREAIRLKPKGSALAHNFLGEALRGRGQLDEAISHYREAIRLDPKASAKAHNFLGEALRGKGQLDEAISHYQAAIRLKPKASAAAHNNLGLALYEKGRQDEAIGHYEESIQLDPKASAKAHTNLGFALHAKGRLDEAIDHFQESIRLDPKASALAYYYLGAALHAKGRLDEAVGHYEEALRLDPKHSQAHVNLGLALEQQGKRDEALDHLRQAATLLPADLRAQNGLRGFLLRHGRANEARLAWRKALDGNPPEHHAWYGYAELCLFLGQQGEYRQARRDLLARFGATAEPLVAERTGRACLLLPGTDDELRRAADLVDRALAADPGKYGWARPYFLFARGLAEYRRGRLDAAAATLERPGGALGPTLRPAPGLVLAMARHRQGHPEAARRALAAAVLGYDWSKAKAGNLDAWVCHVLRREAEALVLPGLPALLAGGRPPRDNAERLALLGACQFEGRHAAAARLYAGAFAADPQLAEDLGAGHRYNAACHAALAASSRGTDAPKDDKDRSSLRGQVLGWLRADLALRRKQAGSAKAEDRAAAQRALRHWQQDADLAGVRDKQALAALPADERAQWQMLWAEVAGPLRRLDAAKPAAAPTGR